MDELSAGKRFGPKAAYKRACIDVVFPVDMTATVGTLGVATSYMSYVLHLYSNLEFVFHPSHSLSAVIFLIKTF